MIIICDGIVICMAVSDIRVMGCVIQGVCFIKLDKYDEMADIVVIYKLEDEDELMMFLVFDEEEQELVLIFCKY